MQNKFKLNISKALFIMCCSVGHVQAEQRTVVVIDSMKFSPPLIKAKKGMKIEFQNKDILPHTVTDSTGTNFDSGIIESGKTWSFTPQSGLSVIQYHCRIHPEMNGTIELSN